MDWFGLMFAVGVTAQPTGAATIRPPNVRIAVRPFVALAPPPAASPLPATSPLSATNPPPAASLPPAPPTDALAIYDRARATVMARTIPPFIAYTQYAAFSRHGKLQAQHDRIVLRMADGKAFITPLPDSPADRIDTRPHVEDRPLVYPTTTFGFVKRRTGEAPSTYESVSTPAPAPPADGSPAVIGRVASTSRDYEPVLAGVETIDGATVYHLKLTPRFDPQHHPIRDLYVDTSTYEPRRIAIEVYAAVGPVHSRPTVIVDYAPIDGTWMIAHASMDFVLRLAFLSYGGSAEFRTSDIAFPTTEPDWMFDPKLLAEHTREGAPAAAHR